MVCFLLGACSITDEIFRVDSLRLQLKPSVSDTTAVLEFPHTHTPVPLSSARVSDYDVIIEIVDTNPCESKPGAR